jgi:phage terminase large subunit
MNRKCQLCTSGEVIRENGKNYSVCTICNATEILYFPQPHQAEFHKDPHIFKAIFGAYGSGKTTTAVMSIVEHVLHVPYGRTAMLAPTMQLLKETSYKELLKYLPHNHIKEERRTKGEEKIILKNGHEILLLPSNEAEKIRSLNLTAFYLEEASNSKYDIYVELSARLRNEAAVEYIVDEKGKRRVKKSRLLGILCSNPDSGWIRTEILYKSDKVYSPIKYPKDPQYNPYLSTHLHSSFQNKYLDPDFQVRIGRGKPDWWVKRYIYGSFEYAEGLVYPMFAENIVDPFTIPPNWKRMFGVDFGLRDPTVMLAIAIDPDRGIVYVYDEHYEAEKPVNHHAEKMMAMLKKVPPGMINGQIVADPAGKARRGTNGQSYFGHYAEYGLWFREAVNNIESGIMKIFTYFSMSKLKIMSNCIYTIKEGREYKYQDGKIDLQKNRGENPMDFNNHAMDTLRYIIQELPDNPDDLVNEVYFNTKLTQNYSFKFPKELQETEETPEGTWYNSF